MNFTVKNIENDQSSPQGEIWVRGPHVIPGYFKDDQKNDKTFVDGWCLTGDIGQIKDGRIHLIGRKKHLFKLS